MDSAKGSGTWLIGRVWAVVAEDIRAVRGGIRFDMSVEPWVLGLKTMNDIAMEV